MRYYEENVDYREQIDKLVQATMDSLDKTATDRTNLLKPLNGVIETLKVIQDAVKDDLALNKKCKSAVPISSVKNPLKILGKPITTIISTLQLEPSVPQREGKGIATDDQPEVQTKLVKSSSIVLPNPNAPIFIRRRYLEEAKRLAMTKTKLIKIVQEEAEKIRIDPKKVISAKACEKFKKAQDAKILKPELITDVKIYPNSKPIVLTVYMNNDKRNFNVHNTFKFANFEITELDELGTIIEKKKSSIAPSQALGRKWKHKELEPKIKVPGLECNRSLPKDQAFQRWKDIHKVGIDSLVSYLVMALMIKTLENARFSLKLKKLIAGHPDQKKFQSNKVKLEAVGYMLD
ncbi:hypothetical protein Tco_0151604 [Tanacetum coccineum]